MGAGFAQQGCATRNSAAAKAAAENVRGLLAASSGFLKQEACNAKAGSPPSGESPHWVDPAMPPPPQLWPALLCIINSSSTSGLTRLVEAKHEAQEAAARERAAAEEARNRAA